MSSLPESELPAYFRMKVIDSIKALSLDYGDQVKLIPKKILWALAGELTDEFDIFYVNSNHTKNQFEESVHTMLKQLDQMLTYIWEKDLKAPEDVKNREEWKQVRLFCREILDAMGEKSEPPESWKPGYPYK